MIISQQSYGMVFGTIQVFALVCVYRAWMGWLRERLYKRRMQREDQR